MWSITKPLWGTGKMLIVEISFCMFRLSVGMFDTVVYVSTLVKRLRYWKTVIQGDLVKVSFDQNKNDQYECILVTWKVIYFDVFVVKYFNNNITTMST